MKVRFFGERRGREGSSVIIDHGKRECDEVNPVLFRKDAKKGECRAFKIVYLRFNTCEQGVYRAWGDLYSCICPSRILFRNRPSKISNGLTLPSSFDPALLSPCPFPPAFIRFFLCFLKDHSDVFIDRICSVKERHGRFFPHPQSP